MKKDAYLLGAQGTDDTLIEVQALIGLVVGLIIVVGGTLALDELGDSSLKVEITIVGLILIVLIHGVLQVLLGSSLLQQASLLLVAGTAVDLLIIGVLIILNIAVVLIILIILIQVQAGRRADNLQGSARGLAGVAILKVGGLIGINSSHAHTELD